jgi:hypothetical protein
VDQTELRILLNTVANTAGATQTQSALRGVATQTQQVNAGLRSSAEAARSASSGFGAGTQSILQFASALTGVQLGVALFAQAGQRITDVLRGSITAQADNERITRATAAAYGSQAESFERFAAGLSEQTGFTRQAILEAALSARTLSTNYGLAIDQTQKLITVSADLARVRGIGVAEAFERVQSAIRGEAEASEFLGLTLNDTFLQQNAANGAYRATFNTLNDATKAQIRYVEVLRQTDAFQGLAASSAAGLDGAMGRANVAGTNLSVTLGKLIEPQAIAGLNTATAAMIGLAAGLAAVGNAQRNIPDIKPGGLLIDFLGAMGPLGGTTPEIKAILAVIEQVNAAERKRVAEAQTNALVMKQTRERALQEERADLLVGGATPATGIRAIGVAAERAQKSVQDLTGELRLLQTSAGALSAITGALATGDVANRALTAASAAVNAIDQARTAQQALLAQQRDLQQQAKITDPRDVAGANAVRERLQLIQQLVPLESQLLATQETQRQLTEAATLAQGRQAQIELSMLPARQEMARLDRESNSAQVELVRLMRERQVLLAQQAAAPATQALEDTRAQIERTRLVLANRRGTTLQERQDARRLQRDLTRNVLPGQELSAFDAQQQLDLVRRGAGAADLADQVRRNAIGQRGAEIRQMIEPLEAQKALVEAQTQQLQLLGQITAAKEITIKHEIEVTINGAVSGTISGDVAADVAGQVATQVYRELTEANSSATIPQPIPLSGVRRVR